MASWTLMAIDSCTVTLILHPPLCPITALVSGQAIICRPDSLSRRHREEGRGLEGRGDGDPPGSGGRDRRVWERIRSVGQSPVGGQVVAGDLEGFDARKRPKDGPAAPASPDLAPAGPAA